MTTRKTLATLIAGLVVGASALAAPNPSPSAASVDPGNAQPAVPKVSVPELGVDEILQRNAAARGGLQAWRAVGSLSLSGVLDAGRTRQDGGRVAMATNKLATAQAKARARQLVQTTGKLEPESRLIQLPFQLDMKRPAKTRLEIPFQGDTAVQVFDGAQGWKLRPYLGRREVEAFSAQELKQALSQQPMDGLLIDHLAKGTAVALAGAELVEGRPNYRLKLTLRNGDVRQVWVDAQTFLESRVDSPARLWNGRMHPVYTYLRDYHPVQGLQIAHRLETAMEGVPGSESIYVEKVALNPALDDARFDRP